MNVPQEIVVATTNAGKVREFKRLLADVKVKIRGLNEFRDLPEVRETGATFVENAAIKAAAYAQFLDSWVLADDSGLEVAALDDQPGVFSARYGGAALSDAERSRKLLFELEKTNDRERAARFVCALILADETGAARCTATGVCSGRIADKPKGTNGFGYDPIFVPDGFGETFGELDDEIKEKIGHRARASREIVRFLHGFLKI